MHLLHQHRVISFAPQSYWWPPHGIIVKHVPSPHCCVITGISKLAAGQSMYQRAYPGLQIQHLHDLCVVFWRILGHRF